MKKFSYFHIAIRLLLGSRTQTVGGSVYKRIFEIWERC